MNEGLAKIRSARSKEDFPFLQLGDDEYVEYYFTRAKICLYMTLLGLGLGLAAILLAFLVFLMGQPALDGMGLNFLYMILFCLIVTVLASGAVTYMVHRGNKLFVTNKRVIQMVMTSPVVTSYNAIDLGSIEDASFHQNGLMQKLFHYGTFRLSTVGDETTYTFPFSDVSPSELQEVSKLISNAKKRTRRTSAKNTELDSNTEESDDSTVSEPSTAAVSKPNAADPSITKVPAAKEAA